MAARMSLMPWRSGSSVGHRCLGRAAALVPQLRDRHAGCGVVATASREGCQADSEQGGCEVVCSSTYLDLLKLLLHPGAGPALSGSDAGDPNRGALTARCSTMSVICQPPLARMRFMRAMPRLNRRDLIRFASWDAASGRSLRIADRNDEHDSARRAVELGEALPLVDILAKVSAISAAKIVGVSFKRKQDIWLYEFKVVEPGGPPGRGLRGCGERPCAQAGGGLMRVLVVEDDPRIARRLSSVLREAGYAVDGVGNGEEAWFRGDTEDYDAVILDLGLPRMDGLTVLKKWRGGRPRRPGADPHRPRGVGRTRRRNRCRRG